MNVATFPQVITRKEQWTALKALKTRELSGAGLADKEAWVKRAGQVAQGLVLDIVEDPKGNPVQLDGAPVFLVRINGVDTGRPVFDEKVIADLKSVRSMHTKEATLSVGEAMLHERGGTFYDWAIPLEHSFGNPRLMLPTETAVLDNTGAQVTFSEVRRKRHFMTRPTYHQTMTLKIPVGQAQGVPKVTGVSFGFQPYEQTFDPKWKREGDVLTATISYKNEKGPRSRVFKVEVPGGANDMVEVLN